MNRDILNVIVSKSDIRGVEEMAGASALIYSIIQQNGVYMDKSAIIKNNSDYGPYETMKLAIHNQYSDLVEFFFAKTYENLHRQVTNQFMEYASKYGHENLVKFFIEKGADNWNFGLRGSSYGGYKNLIEFFIEKCASLGGSIDWNESMYAASCYGNKDLVDFFIEKGANDWRKGISGASCNNHKDLVKFFIDKCASLNCASLNCASLNCASLNCASLNYASLNCASLSGANNLAYGMSCVSSDGHMDLVEICIENGANNWNTCMRYAHIGGHADLVKFFQKKIDENNH